MAGIFSWSSTAGSNSTVDGVNISEGCPAGSLNNAVRSVMAIVRQTFSSALENFLNGTSALAIAQGGTGATTASGARTALGLGALATQGTVDNTNWSGTPLSLANGGTGATTQAGAYAAIATLAASLTNPGYYKLANGLMIQWGTGSIGPNTTGTCTFPTAYSSFAVCLVSGGVSGGSVEGDVHTVGGAGLTGQTIANSANSSATYSFIVVGV